MAVLQVKVTATHATVTFEDVALEGPVRELKEKLAAEDKAGVEPARQRLIYKGHVLKDGRTLESYGTGAAGPPRLWRGAQRERA